MLKDHIYYLFMLFSYIIYRLKHLNNTVKINISNFHFSFFHFFCFSKKRGKKDNVSAI